MTLDTAGDIVLDADGDEVIFKNGSTNIGHVSMDSSNLTIKSLVSDKHMIFQGNDGGSPVTALTLDMSEAGDATFGRNVTVTGNLTVSGTTTTVDTTNTVVKDNLLGLNHGASSNSNDSGIIIERGSTGNDALLIWDESADKWALGTTTSNASSTGNLNMTTGTLVANIEGDVTGNADTATALATGRTIAMTGDVAWTSASFDGSGNVTGSATIQAGAVENAMLAGSIANAKLSNSSF